MKKKVTKKILLVLTGGTICSFTGRSSGEQGEILINELNVEKAKISILEYFNIDAPEYSRMHFECRQPLDTFSENMTLEKWNQLIFFFQEVKWEEYDGVIILHGTDTLAFSSSLFSILLIGVPIPVFFVSSNRPVERKADGKPMYENSNGMDNFKAAAALIDKRILPEVYVIYRNPTDGVMYLHRGAHLKQCANYSDDFYSSTMRNAEDIAANQHKNCPMPYHMLIYRLRELKNRILYLQPYVGMSYKNLPLEKYAAVYHGTYHAGTVCTERTNREQSYSEDSILYLLDQCNDLKISVWCSPCMDLKKDVNVYSSVPIMIRHDIKEKEDKGVKPLYGMTNECVYAKLLVAYNLEMEESEREDFIKEWGKYDM